MFKESSSRLVAFSFDHPWLVLGLTLVVTAGFAAQFPKVTVDTDPKHMLPETAPVRRQNDQVEKDFSLHADVIAVGIVNESGISNRETLARIAELTRAIQKMPGVPRVRVSPDTRLGRRCRTQV